MKALLWIGGIVVAGVVAMVVLLGVLVAVGAASSSESVSTATTPEAPIKSGAASSSNCRDFFPEGRLIEIGVLRSLASFAERGGSLESFVEEKGLPKDDPSILDKYFLGDEETLQWLEKYHQQNDNGGNCAVTIAKVFSLGKEAGAIEDSDFSFLVDVLQNPHRLPVSAVSTEQAAARPNPFDYNRPPPPSEKERKDAAVNDRIGAEFSALIAEVNARPCQRSVLYVDLSSRESKNWRIKSVEHPGFEAPLDAVNWRAHWFSVNQGFMSARSRGVDHLNWASAAVTNVPGCSKAIIDQQDLDRIARGR